MESKNQYKNGAAHNRDVSWEKTCRMFWGLSVEVNRQ